MNINGPEFLHNKYQTLGDSKEVSRAQTLETKEDISPVQAYLDRIERVMNTERPNGKTGADLLENMIMKDFVLDMHDKELVMKLAKDLYESEKRIAIQRGHGSAVENMNLSDTEILEKYQNAIKEKYEIQKQTLSSWLNYLRTSNDYPMWFKYYTVRGLKEMGQFNRHDVETNDRDKDGNTIIVKGPSYSARTTDTIAPFPELNSESLGFVRKSLELQMNIDAVTIPQDVENNIIKDTTLDPETEQKIKEKAKPEFWDLARQGALKNLRNKKRSEYLQTHKNELTHNFINEYPLEESRKQDLEKEFEQRLHTTDFAKLYAFAQVETAGALNRESIEGEWVKYEQGSDYTVLEKSLQGKGTGWCTAEGSAKGQIEKGDFYVYYTKNKDGINTEPRVAIRMEDGKIGEIRGVNTRQELEPELVDIAKEKYQDLPGAEKYERADHDMRLMTEIYAKSFRIDKETKGKVYLDPQLSKSELMFLYEIDRKVESFGYDPDPRVKEVREKRNTEQDIYAVFDCTPDQLARTPQQVHENTKVYVGPLFKDVFKLSQLEHIATSFPEGIIRKEKITIGGKTGSELANLLMDNDLKLWGNTKEMLNSFEFETSPAGTEITSVTVSVAGLGFPNSVTYQRIQDRAKEYGLDVVPHDFAPTKRLSDTDTSWRIMHMKPISADGKPRLFDLDAYGDELGLHNLWGDPDDEWDAYGRFVFSVRK
ncbi:MAG: hypothetical protein KBC22_02220 [Candidatus Pacebacteria bacterium]|nr:hypothetical protein [Candidatus Paceibacterota bacterium]